MRVATDAATPLASKAPSRGAAAGEIINKHRFKSTKLLGFLIANRVGEAKAELLESERDGAMAVCWVAEHRPGGPLRDLSLGIFSTEKPASRY